MTRFQRLFFFVFCGALLFAPRPAVAAYVKRYGTTQSGAMTFIGNSLGLSKINGANNPGTNGSIGAFSSTNGALTVGTFPAGTTLSIANNSATANLVMPGGSTVLYAELIWGGSSTVTGATLSAAVLNQSVTFTTPAGTSSIAPTAATSQNVVGGGTGYYVRSNNVTALVRAAGAGTYTCGNVPGTTSPTEENGNSAGWLLAVVYANDNLPSRNMSVFVGAEVTDGTTSTTSQITGFCAPPTGAVNARVLISTIEGDSNIVGDQLLFGATTPPTNVLSGPNNPAGNFFSSQINSDTGTLNTSGTHGTRNHTPGSNASGARQGWDITNVDASAFITNSQNVAYTRGTSTGDRYVITGLGVQIDVGAPKFRVPVKQVDKATSFIGDTLTYTISVDNTLGTANASNVVFYDTVPPGTSFLSGSLTLDGVPQVGANPATGVPIGTVPFGAAPGSVRTITFQVLVNAIPPPPLTAQYDNSARWTYQYTSCAFETINNEIIATNTVVTTIPRLEIIKAANPTTTLLAGQNITYTITVANTGTGASSGTTLVDVLPAILTYVPNSATLNGVVIPGAANPFATPRLINSPGAAAGQINVGATATITITAVTGLAPPPSITNNATVDPDGGGPAPGTTATVTNPATGVDIGVSINDGKATTTAGAPNTYTITVTNFGTTPITSFTLFPVLPPEVLSPVYTPSSGSYNAATSQWTGVNIPTNGTVTLTLNCNISASASDPITVRVVVDTPGQNDINAVNDSSSDTDTIAGSSDLSVAKSDGKTSVLAGSPNSYTITVTNNGPTTLASLFINDTLPASLQNPTFTPSQGVYNISNGELTGLNLAPSQSITLVVAGTVAAGTSGTITNTVTVSPPVGVSDPNAANNTAVDTTTAGFSITGFVYLDVNHDSSLNNGETGTGIVGLFVKLRPAAGGNATAAAAVDPVTGAFTLSGSTAGNFTLILDNNNTLTDVTPFTPAGYIGTETASGVRALTVSTAAASVTDQNFGLFNGSKLSGVVFNDNGIGGGTPNNGTRDGGEAGISGATVSATDNAGGTTFDTATTDPTGAYTLWIPASAGANPVKIVESNLANYISTGASVGTTAGTYIRAADTTTFTNTVGTTYTGVNFGDVPVNQFTNDGAQIGTPGNIVLYPHVFTAGSGGSVTFSTTHVASPANTGWQNLIYLDSNANGAIDAGENPVTGPITVVAGQQVSLVVKEFVPANAPNGAQDVISLTAQFTYTGANPPLSNTLIRTDVTTVGAQPGVQLTKTVDKTTAKSGDLITYTITYRNISGEALNSFVINDTTPAYTVFSSRSNSALPANLTGVTSTAPAVNSPGALKWTFTGTLAPNSTGTVSFVVKLR